MKRTILSIILFFIIKLTVYSQVLQDSIIILEEVFVKSQRLALPKSILPHSIHIVTENDLKLMNATSVDEVLQHILGLDVRRRGVDGTQSDLYIRGGNFNQTLLLIDGIPMQDSQTGHHTMNAIVSIENIERIEVVKGAASRLYGENAMNGAINIVTKNPVTDSAKFNVRIGSFDTYGVGAIVEKHKEDKGYIFQINRVQSEGYRYNTDFENINSFIKYKRDSYSFIASYGQRKFGANGFYANPDFTDQYEETQTHLLAISKTFKGRTNKLLNTKLYWRRNQDMYIFLRHNPNYYRNLHINNKVGLSFNSTFPTKLGTTGVGLDINQGFLVSNNLNNHNRFTTTFFIDQHSLFFKKKVSIKKGVALSYYSDLGFFAYPGLDISYQFSKSIKLIANIGYTFRNPTYTNLYYHSYTEEGNVELKPEKAFNYEFGLDYSKKNSSISLSYFNRTSKDFIDYVKNSEEEKWKANNIGEINTHGIETNYVYKYSMYNFRQKLDISYAFVNQEYKNGLYTFSRYSLNAFKHQFKTTFSTQFFSFLKQSIYYSYNERFQNPGYHLLDLALTTQLEKWEINVKANNIFSTDYYETNLVPMPKVNYSMQIKYRF